MTLTIDELVKVFHDAYGAQPYSGVGHFDLGSRAGIRAVVTALRDEIIPEKMRITHANDTCTRTSLRRYFHEILAPREGGQAAGDPLSDEARALLSSWKGHGPLPEGQQAPAAPAPTVGQRLIKAAHEAAAIARGDMQPGRVHAASASVCEWKLSNEVGALGFRWLAEPIACGASLAHEGYAKALNMRCLCGLPIALKPEAQR